MLKVADGAWWAEAFPHPFRCSRKPKDRRPGLPVRPSPQKLAGAPLL